MPKPPSKIPDSKKVEVKRSTLTTVQRRSKIHATSKVRPHYPWLKISLAFITTAVVLTLSVTTWWTYQLHKKDQQRQQLQSEYLTAARTFVLTLTSLSTTDAKKNINQILALTTGEAKTDFAANSDNFFATIKKSNVVSVGEISEVGIESLTNNSAQLLVSAISKVTNASGATAEPRVWRLRLTLTKIDSTILTSQLDFAV